MLEQLYLRAAAFCGAHKCSQQHHRFVAEPCHSDVNVCARRRRRKIELEPSGFALGCLPAPWAVLLGRDIDHRGDDQCQRDAVLSGFIPWMRGKRDSRVLKSAGIPRPTIVAAISLKDFRRRRCSDIFPRMRARFLALGKPLYLLRAESAAINSSASNG